jgi:putative heme iron utilization protein
MANAKDRAARELFLRGSFGVLSTISVDVPGYPFGSITPYCTDREGRPVLYTSYIAQHTKNFRTDPRASLTVVEAAAGTDDVQAHGRVTCLGNVRQVEPTSADMADRYFRYFASARQYDQTHDFAFFVLDLVRVRFIGGFGQIYWVEPEEFLLKNPFSPTDESRILQHMNKDHADALKHYANGNAAVMVGIDAEGFDMRTEEAKIRISFDAPVNNMEEARQALVALARR